MLIVFQNIDNNFPPNYSEWMNAYMLLFQSTPLLVWISQLSWRNRVYHPCSLRVVRFVNYKNPSYCEQKRWRASWIFPGSSLFSLVSLYPISSKIVKFFPSQDFWALAITRIKIKIVMHRIEEKYSNPKFFFFRSRKRWEKRTTRMKTTKTPFLPPP